MDYTGITDYSDKRVDRNSIRTTTLLSFVLFAVVIIMLVWGLTTSFIDTYYETLRKQDAMRIAESLEENYERNPIDFAESAVKNARVNGIYIRLDTMGTSQIFDGTSALTDTETYNHDIYRINRKLAKSSDYSTSETVRGTGTDENARLVYATYVTADGVVGILYIIAPLYADPTTLRISRTLLVYISAIVMLVALALAFYLSHRLAFPIQNITRSATEMSKGNYNVKFEGAGFTETKELAKALNQASYEMEKTEFYQREIIANVSHDLKTPLTMIRSYAEKIIDITGDKPEKRNADLNIIISETERLNRLVSEMMTVSNLQSNNVELHKEVFDIVDAADDVYESFLVLNDEDGYEIHFHPCKSTLVMGDKGRIMQVMSNFVSNAVKYSGDNKYVDIQLKRISNRKVAFHCIDHGVGIPSDELSHVWDRYYRTSANHERDIEGTGLGLSIVKGILTLHNAAYGVNSQEGKGSDFWFEMEIAKKPSEKRSDKHSSEQEARPENEAKSEKSGKTDKSDKADRPDKNDGKSRRDTAVCDE